VAFNEEEISYIQSQRLARLATVDGDEQPDVSPVGFDFDGTYFYVGGAAPERTRKFRNVRSGHIKVALVVDDFAGSDPRSPRFVRVYGTADFVDDHTGYMGPGTYMRIKPETSWSGNLAGQPMDGGNYTPPTRVTH
jgi:pyridoxamine 5'-phosphate oxidase family protein